MQRLEAKRLLQQTAGHVYCVFLRVRTRGRRLWPHGRRIISLHSMAAFHSASTTRKVIDALNNWNHDDDSSDAHNTKNKTLPLLDEASIRQLDAAIADPEAHLPALVLAYGVDDATADMAAAITAALPVHTVVQPKLPMGTGSCGNPDGAEPLFLVASKTDWAWLRLVCLRRKLSASQTVDEPPNGWGEAAVDIASEANLDGHEFRRLWEALYLTVGERLQASNPDTSVQNMAMRLASHRGDKVFPRYRTEPTYDDAANEFVYSREESPRNHALGRWRKRVTRIACYMWVPRLKHIRVLTETEVCADSLCMQHAKVATLLVAGPHLALYGIPPLAATPELTLLGPMRSAREAFAWAAQWSVDG